MENQWLLLFLSMPSYTNRIFSDVNHFVFDPLVMFRASRLYRRAILRAHAHAETHRASAIPSLLCFPIDPSSTRSKLFLNLVRN